MSSASPPAPPGYTAKQGQYLAFIHAYRRLHDQAPAEADIQRFFRVSPPSVHQMILKLAARRSCAVSERACRCWYGGWSRASEGARAP
jgi:hypothetical protein